jgi:hypothetical protein
MSGRRGGESEQKAAKITKLKAGPAGKGIAQKVAKITKAGTLIDKRRPVPILGAIAYL